MKLLILLLSLIFISCSNNTSEKIYTKTLFQLELLKLESPRSNLEKKILKKEKFIFI